MSLVSVIVDLFKWLMEAAIQYNSTELGNAQLVDLLDALESLGIDVPFFDPTATGSPLNMSSVPQGATAQDTASTAAFKARHPELFKQEAE